MPVLIRNLELNGLTNVTAINTAVSSDGGKKSLYVDASDSAWATTDASLACSEVLCESMTWSL